jgi:D-mannonate dehydratase
VFNPVVRSKLTAVHEASSKVMKYDLNSLTSMDDAQLMDVLRQMQQESEELAQHEEAPGTVDSSRDYIRAKLDTIRKNVRAFQAQQRRPTRWSTTGLSELDDEGLSELDDPSPGGAGDPPPA